MSSNHEGLWLVVLAAITLGFVLGVKFAEYFYAMTEKDLERAIIALVVLSGIFMSVTVCVGEFYR